MRLIAADPGRGFSRAGVEIRLAPGALTYWRTPGEAGSPPVFNFDGSENVAEVAVLYPAPTRIDESGADVFGYREEVIFPLHVTPKDGARPALLALTLRYAVCERICLPSKGQATLALPPLQSAAAADGEEAAALAAAEAEVPLRLTASERDAKIAIVREDGASPPTWRMTFRAAGVQTVAGGPRGSANASSARDLFAEASDGWYFETRKTERPNEFLIVEVERPKAAAGARPPLVLTLARPGGNYEFSLDLDGASAALTGAARAN